MQPTTRNFAIKVSLALIFPVICMEATAAMIMYQTGKSRRHAMHDMFQYVDNEFKRILPSSFDKKKNEE